MSLMETLERTADALVDLAPTLREADGDPHSLLENLQPEQAREVLVWVLAHADADAGELVEAWGEWEKGAEVMLGVSDEILAEQGVSKVGRKVLRKAHHRLRSRGIEVKTESAKSVSRRPAPVADDPFEAAYLSSPDFRGARVGYIADRHPAGGARLFEARFDEGRGILDFKVYNAGRTKVRGFLRSLSSAQAQRLFDVPRTALCALVRRASLAQPADRPLPAGFLEWRQRIFPESLETESTPGGLVRLELAGSPDGSSEASLGADLESVIEWVLDGSIGPWPPATSLLSEWMDRGREETEGLEGEARESAIEAWRASVTELLSAQDDRSLLARHLEELAWVRRQTGGLSEAASVVAMADAVASDDDVATRLAGARVDSLFAPFLGELRMGDAESAEAAADAG
jgi:hypothetical protein